MRARGSKLKENESLDAAAAQERTSSVRRSRCGDEGKGWKAEPSRRVDEDEEPSEPTRERRDSFAGELRKACPRLTKVPRARACDGARKSAFARRVPRAKHDEPRLDQFRSECITAAENNGRIYSKRRKEPDF